MSVKWISYYWHYLEQYIHMVWQPVIVILHLVQKSDLNKKSNTMSIPCYQRPNQCKDRKSLLCCSDRWTRQIKEGERWSEGWHPLPGVWIPQRQQVSDTWGSLFAWILLPVEDSFKCSSPHRPVGTYAARRSRVEVSREINWNGRTSKPGKPCAVRLF